VLVTVVYRPFFGLSEPFVRHYFGSSDGSLGYYVLGGVLLGVSVYSVIAALAGLVVSREHHAAGGANA